MDRNKFRKLSDIIYLGSLILVFSSVFIQLFIGYRKDNEKEELLDLLSKKDNERFRSESLYLNQKKRDSIAVKLLTDANMRYLDSIEFLQGNSGKVLYVAVDANHPKYPTPDVSTENGQSVKKIILYVENTPSNRPQILHDSLEVMDRFSSEIISTPESRMLELAGNKDVTILIVDRAGHNKSEWSVVEYWMSNHPQTTVLVFNGTLGISPKNVINIGKFENVFSAIRKLPGS